MQIFAAGVEENTHPVVVMGAVSLRPEEIRDLELSGKGWECSTGRVQLQLGIAHSLVYLWASSLWSWGRVCKEAASCHSESRNQGYNSVDERRGAPGDIILYKPTSLSNRSEHYTSGDSPALHSSQDGDAGWDAVGSSISVRERLHLCHSPSRGSALKYNNYWINNNFE